MGDVGADPRAELDVEAGRLSPDLIVATTLAMIDESGLEAVTMRALAKRLDVKAASLYGHVSSKQALIDSIADSVMSRVDSTAFATMGWRKAVEHWAWSYYETLLEHPNLVPYLGQAFGRLPSIHRLASAVYSGLRRAGWSEGEATRIAGAIRYAVYGAALGSFAGGFTDEAAQVAHLEHIGRLREQADKVDREVLALLISHFLDGLERDAGLRGQRIADGQEPHDTTDR